MPTFRYRAIAPDGQMLDGTLTAGTQPEAVSLLRGQGAKPIKIELDGGTVNSPKTNTAAKQSKKAYATKKEAMMFTSQLAALLKAGIVLSQALAILEEQAESDHLRELLRIIHEDIHGGDSLSDALKKHPQSFSSLYCSMVKVGESGGVLDVVLKQLAGFMEAEQALISNITTAMAYPLLIVMVGIGSIIVMVTVVIPRLGSVFADFGDRLPWLTKALINTSDVVLGYWWLITAALVGLFYGFRAAYNTPTGREKIETIKENIPALGSMLIKVQIARFARTMGTLIQSGIPVMQALNLVVDTTGSYRLRSALRTATEKVKKGEGIAKPLKETGFFPPMVVNLISVGEESGSLDEMMFQIADTYDIEVQHAIKRFITIFEPLVIILMAIGVGGILVAFLLPILNISNMVG